MRRIVVTALAALGGLLPFGANAADLAAPLPHRHSHHLHLAARLVPPGYAYGGYGNGPGPGWELNGYGPGYGPGYAPGYGYIPAGGPTMGFDPGS